MTWHVITPKLSLIVIIPCDSSAKSMKIRLILKILVCSVGILGYSLNIACTPKKIASDLTSQIFRGGAPSFEMEPDPEIGEMAGIPLLKVMEAFHYDNPHNKTYRVLLARSFANYAFGFLEWNMLQYQDSNPELYQKNFNRAKRFYAQGKHHGLEVLKRKGSFEKALNKDLGTFKKSLNSFGKGSVPELFWTAFNWGSTINLNKDSPLAIVELPKVEAMMRRVLELDENFYYASPHLFFGVFYGSRPKMFGGNPIKSKEHFEKALAAYERKFLLAQVTYAHIYAVQNQDRALFETLLNEVLNTDPAVLPEQRLGNEMAHLKARWLLDNAHKFFGGAQ